VIDDEELMREVIKQSIERFGFQVITAVDGQEGLDFFKNRKNDISAVVLDMTMPRMSGEETYLQLRAIQRDVRVLLTSGYNGRMRPTVSRAKAPPALFRNRSASPR